MEVLAHPDPFVLEHELLERVARAQASDPLAAVLVVVPTRRLADHVLRRLGERSGARIGVHVLHYRALALRVLDEAGARPRTLSARLEEALLHRVLRRRPRDPWAELVERRPGALPGLLGAARDLREAGLSAAEVSAALDGGPRERSLAAIWSDWVDELERLEAAGVVDETGLIAAACRAAGAFVARHRFRAIVHHGAYELIGAHLDLLRELDRASRVAFLLPAEPGSPATAYAERFARRHLPCGGELARLADRPGGLLGDRLGALYDEDASPGPLRDAAVVWSDAQGDRGELKLASTRALDLARRGVPGREVAVLARTLAPYAPSLEAVVRGDGVPASTSARVPLRRDPAVHDLLVMLRAVAEDFPRRATVELLRSPRVDWSALGEPATAGDRAEAWSREARLLRGLDGWRRHLPERVGTAWVRADASDDERREREAQAARRREQAASMGRALERLAERLAPARARRWSAHAEAVEGIVRELLPVRDGDDPGPARRAVLEVLDDMRALETLLGERGEIAFADAVRWIERAVDATDVPVDETDAGGVRVLDVMQARGLTFEAVALIGLNERVFPRIAREDPFLGDDARARLAERTGRPLPLRRDSEDEEHLLLALALGSARRELAVSWQRADDDGKSRSPSLALREIARVVDGVPDLEPRLEAAVRFPAHPEAWLASLARDPGLLRPADERVLRALRSPSPEAARDALAAESDGLARGLDMLRATESFAPVAEARAWDGRVGEIDGLPPYSTDALERLGGCPLQFFFRRVLGVRELDDETDPWSVDRRETGIVFHRALELLYGRLRDEGRFDAGDGESLARRARGLLPDAWAAATAEIRARLEPVLPSFWACVEGAWRGSLERFVDEDLARMGRAGARVVGLERPVDDAVDLGGGRRLAVSIRFDRVVDAAGEPAVGDYKTGKVSGLDDVTAMLKGQRVQVPVYWLAAGGRGVVELLGVGPGHDPAATAGGDRRLVFEGFDETRHREGFLETLRVLLSLVDRGAFPLNPGHRCSYCAYAQACRRNHPPTLEREEHARDTADYRLLRTKTKTRRATLDEIRASEGNP